MTRPDKRAARFGDAYGHVTLRDFEEALRSVAPHIAYLARILERATR